MAQEIEAKMRIADLAPVEAALVDAGAERGPRIDEWNAYYDRPGGELRHADRGLRIRVERHSDRAEPLVRITCKGPRAPGPVKSRREVEVLVGDADAAEQLLAELGYVRTLRFEKRRLRWRLGGCLVELDTLPVLGHFVEIEGPTEAEILAVRARLGLAAVPLLRESYAVLVGAVLARRGDDAGELPFDAAAENGV